MIAKHLMVIDEGYPRHVFHKVVKSPQHIITTMKTNTITVYEYLNFAKGVPFFQASWAVSSFLASLEQKETTFGEN